MIFFNRELPAMYSCSRLTCHEEFEKEMDLRNHKEQVHYKHKCEICQKRLRTKQGLKTHHTRVHKDDINLKNASIREALEFTAQFQNVFKDYHENIRRRFSIENNLNLVNFFRVRPTKICFKAFKNKVENDKVTIEEELTLLISGGNDDITAFWSRILTYFKKELSEFSAEKHFDVFEFELENTGVEKYYEKVQSYRQCISACFKTISDTFEVVKDNNLVEATETNNIVGKLTLRKLQIEILSDISLATNYIYFDAHKIVEICKQVYKDVKMSYQDRFSNLFDLKQHVQMIDSTIVNIKTDLISEDYEDIIETVKVDLKYHKTVVDNHLVMLQAENILTPYDKRENLLPQSSRQSQVELITINDDSQDDDEDDTEDEDEDDIENESENGEVDANDDEPITVNADNKHDEEDDTDSDDIDQLLMVSDANQDITDSDEASVNNSPQSSTQSERESLPEVVTLDDDDEGPVHDVVNNLIQDQNVVGSRIDVSKVNLDRLIYKRWLCDAIIQAYLHLLNKLNKNYLCYDTTFYATFTEKGYPGVQNHYRREKALSKEKILIPVCENSHWFLIVIDLKRLQLYCLDPLYSQTLERLKHFRDNYLHPLYTSNSMSLPTFSLNVCRPPTIPAQKDGYNCGVFLLAFAKSIFFQRAEFDFHSRDMDPFRIILAHELRTQQLTKKIRQTDEDDDEQPLPDTEDEVEETDEETEEQSHAQQEVVEILDSQQNVQPVGHNTDEDEEAVHDTEDEVEETEEDTEEQSDGQQEVVEILESEQNVQPVDHNTDDDEEPVPEIEQTRNVQEAEETEPEFDYNRRFVFQIYKTIRQTDQHKEEPDTEQQVQEILDSLQNVETVANTEEELVFPPIFQQQCLQNVQPAVHNLEHTSALHDIDNISTPINSPISDFNRDVRYDFGQSSSNQMNIRKELSATVNEESVKTNKEPSTNKKRKFEETLQYKELISISKACKKLELENNIHANSMESEILDEEPEPEPVALNINDDELNSDNNEEQEMVVDIVEEPQPQILEDLQEEIPIVDNNEADIKINGQQMLTVFMKREHYFDLSKPQMKDISKKMEKTVRYHSKDLMRRQKFTADPEQILKYLEHVEEKNLAVTFNFDCLFDKPVENEEHQRELFDDMLSDQNIDRTAQFPSSKYFFKDINISQFKTFLTIFN